MLKKCVLLVSVMLFVLTACQSPVYNQSEGNVADVKLKAQAARKKFDNQGKPAPTLEVKKGMYVDTRPISLYHEPSWLKNRVVIRGDQLPFSYYSRTIASGAGNFVLTKYQPGLDPAINITMSYSGTLKGALDLLAAKTGYIYSIRGNSIYWQQFITKTYQIAFMPGASEYLLGKQSGSGGDNTSSSGGTGVVSNYVSSDYSSAEYSNLKGIISIWSDLENTIKQMLSDRGTVMVSQSTTSVTVKDRPSNVELIGQYIKNINNNLSKQVLVKIQVLEVNLSNDYNFGIDWNIVINAFHNSKFVINGNYGTPAVITPLTAQTGSVAIPGSTTSRAITTPVLGTEIIDANGIPAYQILFNALNQQGKTSLVSEPRVLCLNNQVSVVRIVTSEGYVASIQNTTLAGSTTGGTVPTSTVTSQVTPGTIITGVTLYILPKILNEKIYLQVNADLSTRDALVPFGPSGSQIQLPTITEKHFNQRSMIKSGDTLILSGFRQTGNTANANQFLNSQALGGKASLQMNKETIVLITPYVLNGTTA